MPTSSQWVWAEEGLDTSGLNPAAGSFVYSGAGTVHTSSSYQPQVGDAIVYEYEIDGNGTDVASHVGIVTAVNSDGSIDTENGDFNGDSGTEAEFSSTSSVVEATIPSSQDAVGDTPSSTGMEITDYVTPSGSGFDLGRLRGVVPVEQGQLYNYDSASGNPGPRSG